MGILFSGCSAELFDELAGGLLVLGGGRGIDLAFRRSLDLLLDFGRHDDLIRKGCETLAGLFTDGRRSTLGPYSRPIPATAQLDQLKARPRPRSLG